MNTKRWISVAIVAVAVVLSLLLVKLFPFWVTLACVACLAGGFIAGYLFKEPIEEIAEVVDAQEIVEKFKEWFSSLTATQASKAVSAARKAKE